MSHLTELNIHFNNLDALEKAVAQHHGGKLIRGATTYKWVGKWFGDSPIPENLVAGLYGRDEYLRVCAMPYPEQKAYMENILGRCSHKIVFPGHTYEVGVVEVGGNNILIWDWATPLKNIMGYTDSLGRENLEPLFPLLSNYFLNCLREQMDINHGEDNYSINYTHSPDKKTIDWEIVLE